MAQYIDKDTVVAEIEKQRQLIFPQNTGEMKVADVPKPLEQGWLNALSWIKKTINTLEVKEVDLEKEIKDYFDSQPIITRSKGVDYRLIPTGVDIAKHFFELGIAVSNKVQKGK